MELVILSRTLLDFNNMEYEYYYQQERLEAARYDRASKLQYAQSEIDKILSGTLLVVSASCWICTNGMSHTRFSLPWSIMTLASMCASNYYITKSTDRRRLGTKLKYYSSNTTWEEHEKMPVMDRVRAMVERQESLLK